MKVIKSIFDKSYIVEAQAIKAIAKEFGVDAKYYEARQIEGSKKWQVCDIYKPDPIIEVATGASDEPSTLTLAEALAESGETLEELLDVPSNAAADAKANASMGLNALKPRFSSVIRPTKLVWDIADCMPKASRKEVMEECVRQGVAYGTARTQYQAWFKASQEALRGDIRQPYEKGTK